MAERREADPLTELRSVQRRLNALLDSTLSRSGFEAPEDFDVWSPTCDAWVDGGEVRVSVELPGVERSTVEARLEGEELVVEGRRDMTPEAENERYHRVERAYGRFSRRLRLPAPVDGERAEARLERGVLRLRLPIRADRRGSERRLSID